MTTTQTCVNDAGKTCDSVCAQQQGTNCAVGGTVSLPEVLRRFKAEAIHGTCDTGRYRCPYFTWGNGPPLVFICGLADLPDSFVMPMSVLSQQFRCVGYMLPEGKSDGAVLKGYAHADLVADLFALLDHLGLEKTYLFGSSFGSTIALAAMQAQPARVPRAMLQGGFARRRLRLGQWLLASCARYWPGNMRHLPLRRLSAYWRHRGPFATRPADVWDYFKDCAGAPRQSATAHRALIMHALDLRPILPQIRQPVLLICGAHDPLVDKECEAQLLQGLPCAQRIEIAGCGHFPYFSHPELLAQIVRLFLTPSAPQSAPALFSDASPKRPCSGEP